MYDARPKGAVINGRIYDGWMLVDYRRTVEYEKPIEGTTKTRTVRQTIVLDEMPDADTPKETVGYLMGTYSMFGARGLVGGSIDMSLVFSDRDDAVRYLRSIQSLTLGNYHIEHTDVLREYERKRYLRRVKMKAKRIR